MSLVGGNKSTSQNSTRRERKVSGGLTSFRTAIRSASKSATLEMLEKSFKDKIEGIDVHGYSPEALGINVGCLVFARKVETIVYFSVFLVNVDNVELGSKPIRKGLSLEEREVAPLNYVLADILTEDKEFLQVLSENLKAKYNADLAACASTSFLPEITLAKINSDGKLDENIVAAISVDVETAIVSMEKDIPFVLNEMIESDQKLVFNISHSNDQITNTIGLPVFQNFAVKSTLQKKRGSNNNNDIPLTQLNSDALFTISGTIDMEYNRQNVNGKETYWSLIMNITRFKSHLNYSNFESFTWSMMQVMALLQGDSRLKPIAMATAKTNNLGINFNDLNIDIKEAGEEPFDMTSPDFSVPGFAFNYIDDVSPCVLQVNETSPDNVWAKELLNADPNSEIYDVYYDALCGLFDIPNKENPFEKAFERGIPFGWVETDNKEILGYYLDENDVPTDISTMGYLVRRTILSNELFRSWESTYNESFPLNVRLARRLEIIKEMYPNFVHTGYSIPLTINPELIKALHECTLNIGIEIQYDGTSSIDRGIERFNRGRNRSNGLSQRSMAGSTTRADSSRSYRNSGRSTRY